MNKIGIIGNQIKYTLSPKIHEFFARQSQIEINYQVIDCEPESFEIEVIKFFQDTNAVGLNVTIPFKEDALKISLTKDIQAEKSNSCNTLYKNGKTLEAYSTDGEGFLRSIEKFLDIKHKNILIIGAGGSARSVG
ncbi:MAG: shikimate dehydrogenase, partial [Gammaproteobacteria bacterium]